MTPWHIQKVRQSHNEFLLQSVAFIYNVEVNFNSNFQTGNRGMHETQVPALKKPEDNENSSKLYIYKIYLTANNQNMRGLH